MTCCYSTRGDAIVTGGVDGVIKLWESRTGTHQRTWKGHAGGITRVSFGPSGGYFVSSAYEKNVLCWNLAEGAQVAPSFLISAPSVVNSSCVSPTGEHVVVAAGYHLQLWTLATTIETVDDDHERGDVAVTKLPRLLRDHPRWEHKSDEHFRVCCFSPSGAEVLTCGGHRLVLWDTFSGVQKASVKAHDDIVYACCFSPSGDKIVSGSRDRTLRIWDAYAFGRAEGQPLHVLQGHSGSVETCCFSLDAKTIISGGGDKEIRIWN